ncbi:MAG: diheme cytochrome c-553 [Gemmatimonadetes bacterium]|nr:diheme cytochrome c-553 [Gemmatimonadota bacterium]MBI2536655.1 diheme cytochrome c-553 [Gemmatimonadota bacterium]
MVKTVVTAVSLGLLAAACVPREASQAGSQDPAARGAYLAVIGGCDDCHTPKIMTPQGPVPDTTRRLSGHPAAEKLPPFPGAVLGPDKWGAVANNHLTAWAGPWGVSFASNLTPDETGLRAWNDSLFIVTMRTGTHLGSGRPILPPMPWFNLAAMTDDDLRAMFAFLRTLKPVSNQVPTPLPRGGGER